VAGNYIGTPMTYTELETHLKRYGCGIGELQGKWQSDPPSFENCPAWWNEATLAVLDALISQGIEAWDGDAVGCVVNIIHACLIKKVE